MFEATADRFFAEPRRSIDGWETAAVTQARIVAAVDHVVAASPPGDVAIVAHGGVGTLLQCARRGVISRALDQPSQGHWLAFVREAVACRTAGAASSRTIDGCHPTAFATSDPLSDDDLHAAGPPRYPRPSRLAEPLTVKPPKAAAAAERLGLQTVGELLEHLPRDRRTRARSSSSSAGETATVVVEVRSITSRSVRRRGMRPLVEAVVADETGTMKVTFFNQPWLERKYKPGTRLLLNGKYEGRNRFRVQGHAESGEAVGAAGGGRRDLPRDRGLSLDADPRARARARRRGARVARAAPRPPARAGAAARPRRRAARRPLRRPRGRPPAARLRRVAAAPDGAAAPPRAVAARARAPRRWSRPAS